VLPLPAGATSSNAVGIDAQGVVYGDVVFAEPGTNGFNRHPYAWPASGFVALPESGLQIGLRAVDHCGNVALTATPESGPEQIRMITTTPCS
jgi:hypothetical protein